MKSLSLGILFVLLATVSYGQVVSSGGGTGDWSDPDSWSPSGVPDESSGTITIQAFHTITVSDVQSADELTVEGDGRLTIANGGELTIVDGSGDDLTVAIADFITTFSDGNLNIESGGELINQGQISTPQLTFVVESGGQFTHNQNAGAVPTVTWNNGSIIELQGVTNTLPSGIDQTFHDFNYNCSGQTAGILYLNGLTSVNGDLNIISSNARFIAVSSGATTLTVGGDVTISGNSKFYLSPTANVTLDIGGDLTVDSNQAGFALLFTANASCNIDVGGNFVKSNTGTINFAASSGTGTLNVDGNFTISAGTLTESSTGEGNINFSGTSVQVFSNSGTISNTINFAINSNAILDLGTQILSGSGTFATSNLSELRIGSTASGGAIQTGTSAGNIRVSGTRTFTSGSAIVYSGSGAQFIGNGHPTSSGVDLEINNSNGVSLASAVTVGGDLTLTSGDLTVGTNTLTLQAQISGASSIGVSTTSNVAIEGTGTFGAFPFVSATPTLNNFTIDRAGETAVFEDNVTVNGALALTQGNLDFRGQTLNLGGTVSGGGNLLVNSSSTLNITGTSAFGTIQFDPSANTIGTLSFNRSSTGTATLQGTITISTALTLTNGTLTNNASMFMGNGSLLTKNSNATLSGNSPETSGGSTYNVVYTNAGQTTGSEIPDPLTTDALGDLTLNTSGTVTLDQNLQVNGDVTLDGGSFSIGSNQLSIAGDWVRNSGSLSTYTGQVIFNGTSLINGTNTATFVNFQVASGSTITLPSGNININGNIQIDPSATFVANGGTVTLGTTSAQNIAAGGATLNNIAVNKASGTVTVASQVNLAGRMTFSGSSTSTIASGGNLVVISTSDGTSGNGSIGIVPSGANITGNVVVQRFMSGEGRIYRYLSAPVSGTNFEQWRDDFPITGTFSDPSTGPGINSTSPSLFRYNESLTGLADDGWEAHPTSGALASHTIEVGRGYATFIREDVANTTVDMTGSLNLANVSDINLNVTYNDSGNGISNEGWNLVGNPFASSVDWDNILSGTGGTRTNVDNGIHVRDNGAGGVYRTYDGVVGDLTGGLISTGQAFWVRTNANSPMLTMNEQAKNLSTATFYRMETVDPEVIQISLTDGVITDNTFIALKENTTIGYDLDDTPNLNNVDFDITTFGEDETDLAINYIGSFGCVAEIPIKVADVTTGSYTLEFSQLESLNSSYGILLVDNFTGATQDIATNTSYDFNVDESNSDTFGSSRFVLQLSTDLIDSNVLVESVESICSESTGILAIINSQIGISYSLEINGAGSDYELVGNGSNIEFIISSDDLSSGSNSIDIIASLEGCNSKSIEEVSVNKVLVDTSIQYELNDTLCESEDLNITLNDSEVGVDYQLLVNGSIYGDIKEGTGSNLSFDIANLDLGISNSINFTATNGSCSYSLIQEETVEKIVLDDELNFELKNNLCSSENLFIQLNNSESGVTYQVELNGELYGNSQVGTGSSLNFEVQTVDLNDSDNSVEIATSFGDCVSKLIQSESVNIVSINPVISVVDGELISNYEDGNQWFLNGELIEGATSNTFTPITSGEYELQVTIDGCSGKISKEYIVNVTTGVRDEFIKGLTVYPNPVKNYVIVEAKVGHIEYIEIFDAKGNMYYSNDVNTKKFEYNSRYLSDGIYFIRLISNENVVINRFVKR